jgi:hypothetical protein
MAKARQRYFLFRYGEGSYGYRMEKAVTPAEACKLAFGSIYKVPYNGNVVYKDLGTRSPKYATVATKQGWTDGQLSVNYH